MVLKAMELWRQIRADFSLENFEKEGLMRGEVRGKKPDVPINVLVESVGKQYRDFVRAYGINDREEMKRCCADLRNVAGIVFLQLEGKRKAV